MKNISHHSAKPSHYNKEADHYDKNGFKVLKQCAIDGSSFNDKKTDRILTIAMTK